MSDAMHPAVLSHDSSMRSVNPNNGHGGVLVSSSRTEPASASSTNSFGALNVSDARRRNTVLQKMALIQDELLLIEEQLALLEYSNSSSFSKMCHTKVTEPSCVPSYAPESCHEAIPSSEAVAEETAAAAAADAIDDAEHAAWLGDGTTEATNLAIASNDAVNRLHGGAGSSSNPAFDGAYSKTDAEKESMPHVEDAALMMQSSCPMLDTPGELADGDVHPLLDVELCQQVARNNVAAVRTLLDVGADPNSLDYNESTLLHIACRHNSVSVAHVLLSHGADYTLLDRERHTALDVAGIEGHVELVELLQQQQQQHMADMHANSTAAANAAAVYGGRTLTSHSSSNVDSVYTGGTATGEGGGVGGSSTPTRAVPETATASNQNSQNNFDQYASEITSPMSVQHTLDFSSVPQPMVGSLIVIMMGLPGRAKTFVAQQIRRYFQWNGLSSFIFADQYYRRRAEGIVMDANRPAQAAAAEGATHLASTTTAACPKATIHPSHDYDAVEKLSAQLIAKAVTQYVNVTSGVAILDARMSSHARRKLLLRAISKTRLIRSTRVIVVEIVVNNCENVRRNVRMKMETIVNPPERFEELYYKLMAQHEVVYETLNPVTDANLSYIRVDDEENISLNMISGWMPTRLAYMLHNLYNSPQNLYLTCPGEYEDMIAERIGGNSRLTERGEAYAVALYEYFLRELPAPMALFVMSSCAKRCRQTVEHFVRSRRQRRGSPLRGTTADSSTAGGDMDAGGRQAEGPKSDRHGTPTTAMVAGEVENAAQLSGMALDANVEFFPTLDDVNHGDCEGMSFAEVLQTMPSTLQYISDDPYYTAWPNGECIHQVFNDRLEPHIHDIQASSLPVLVCSHVELLQGLYAYFVSSNEENAVAPQEAYRISIPYESVVKIHVVGVKRVAEVIDLSSEVEMILYERTNSVTTCTQPHTLYNPYNVPWYRHIGNSMNVDGEDRSDSGARSCDTSCKSGKQQDS